MKSGIADILSNFPKSRPALSDEHNTIYFDEYKKNRDGVGIVNAAAQCMETWMHKQVSEINGKHILELGAGTLNHIRYETSPSVYDIVEPMKGLYQGKINKGIPTHFYERIEDVPEGNQYDKILSIAVLEHMENLPFDIAHGAIRLARDGGFYAGIPSEGGFLWWLGWRMTTGLAYFAKHRMDYGVVMRHEHLNSAHEILSVCKWIFDEVKIRRFPTPLHHISFYTYVEAHRPNVGRCRAILRKKTGGLLVDND